MRWHRRVAIFFMIALLPIFTTYPFPSATAEDTLRISAPALAGDSTPIRETQVGDKLVVTANVENRGKDVTTVVVVEVRDKEGVTVMLGWQTATIKEGEAAGIGVAWVPKRAGDYELRVFALSGLDAPVALTPVSTSKVSIASLSGSRAVAVGDKTFEVPYQLSAQGAVRSLRVDVPTMSIVAKTNIAQDANLTLVLPIRMLEQLEQETNKHYCVGNGFVIFVNEAETYVDVREAGADQIFTIQLKQGLNKVEFVGVDILEAPPTCLTGQFKFAKDLPINVKSWYDAVTIARNYLQNGTYPSGPVGDIEMVYVDSNGTAFIVDKYDDSHEAYPYFSYKSADSYFWIVTLNYAHNINTMEYTFTIDAKTKEVKGMVAS